MGKDGYIYVADDRALINGKAPKRPGYLSGPDWERASHGLFAITINNRDGSLAKIYDLGRTDNSVVLFLFNGVGHWIYSMDDAENMNNTRSHDPAKTDVSNRERIERARR
jgi:hypothetical protein